MICPHCHPSTTTPHTATGRAFTQADAAGEEAKRIIAAARAGGHQPWRNPADQSVYLKGIS